MPPGGYYPGYGLPPYGLPPHARPPETLPHDGKSPVPDGYRADTQLRKGLLIAGTVTFGSLYLIGGLTASIIDTDPPRTCTGGTGGQYDCEESHAHRWLYAPIIGPFVTAATNPESRSDSWTWMLVMDGLVQTASVAAIIAAVAAPKKVLVRNDIAITPLATEDGGGIALSGRF